MSPPSFVRWHGLAALVVALAYTGLLLLQFLSFYLAFLQPFQPDPSLDSWSAVVLLAGILAALAGLFPLLGGREWPDALVLLELAGGGAVLLLCGAVVEAL